MNNEYIKQFEEMGFLYELSDDMKLKVGTQMAKCVDFCENLQPNTTLSEDDIDLFTTLSFAIIRRIVTGGYYEPIDFNEMKEKILSNAKRLQNIVKLDLDLEAEICAAVSEEYLKRINKKPTMGGKPILK